MHNKHKVARRFTNPNHVLLSMKVCTSIPFNPISFFLIIFTQRGAQTSTIQSTTFIRGTSRGKTKKRKLKMDKISSELNEPNLAKIIESSIPHSFSYEGYEQLHEEAMDKISVSIYSDFEEAFDGISQTDFKDLLENQEKKMKISLSQEQLKLKTGDSKNFLSVPISSRKSRSASFSIKLTQPRAVNIPEVPIDLKAEIPRIKAYDENDDEVVYAVPNRVLRAENLIRTSSASLTPSDVMSQISSTCDVNKTGFKYSFSFYCKVCNNILNDPRTLDCLHTFCMQCLSKLDASNDLQNNQFWRKISGNSESSCKSTFLSFRIKSLNFSSF